jgi:hypothetical protein
MGLILYFFIEARATGAVGLPVAAHCANNKGTPRFGSTCVRLI